jgi:carbonic anhydrase
MLTEIEQQILTPNEVIERLKEGNRRFTESRAAPRNLLFEVKATKNAQHPMACILSCIDSRVVPEFIFDIGIGDIFTVRTAGNVVHKGTLACLEYGCKISNAKLALVLGHTDCGAVKGVCDGVDIGNLSTLLGHIRPALEQTEETGNRSSTNQEFVNRVSRQNVLLMIENVREGSPVLREMEQKGEILIAGATYDLSTGLVEFLS